MPPLQRQQRRRSHSPASVAQYLINDVTRHSRTDTYHYYHPLSSSSSSSMYINDLHRQKGQTNGQTDRRLTRREHADAHRSHLTMAQCPAHIGPAHPGCELSSVKFAHLHSLPLLDRCPGGCVTPGVNRLQRHSQLSAAVTAHVTVRSYVLQ